MRVRVRVREKRNTKESSGVEIRAKEKKVRVNPKSTGKVEKSK